VSAPLFHVKRGHPSPEELAAVTTVLTALTRAAAAGSSRARAGPPRWGDPAAAHRRPFPPPGPGVWVATGRLGTAGGLWTAAGPMPQGPLRSPSGGPSAGAWGSRVPWGPERRELGFLGAPHGGHGGQGLDPTGTEREGAGSRASPGPGPRPNPAANGTVSPDA
jgi:hypothetical protein